MKKPLRYTEIGNVLRQLRGGLTQKEFAARIGISERAYQWYEHGKRLPGLDVLLKVSSVCNVPIHEILADSPDKRRSKELIEGAIRDLDKGETLVGEAEALQGLKWPKSKMVLPKGGYDRWRGEPLFDGEDLQELQGKLFYIFTHAPDEIKQRVVDFIDTIAQLTALVESKEGAGRKRDDKS